MFDVRNPSVGVPAGVVCGHGAQKRRDPEEAPEPLIPPVLASSVEM